MIYDGVVRSVVRRIVTRWPGAKPYYDDFVQEGLLVAWLQRARGPQGVRFAVRRHLWREGRRIVFGFRLMDHEELPRFAPPVDTPAPSAEDAPEPDPTARIAEALDAAAAKFPPNPKTSPASSRFSAELYYRNKAGDSAARLADEYGLKTASAYERIRRAAKYLEREAA